MAEIKCPKCGEVFQIDESNYQQILAQVRNEEFDKELKRTKADYEEKLHQALDLTKQKMLNDNSKQLDDFKSEISKKDMMIQKLKSELTNKETENKLEISKALANKDKEISTLTIESKTLKETYESKLKDKDEMIAYYKDLKAKASTKMVGESLEVHCQNEFNKLRATAFKSAYFDKDNEVSKSGSKGDFIFKDFDDEGNEYISIMFEMKNERDETATKHKNEDFFKELDKDRKEKGCEYAVLVSMLEADSDLYNEGIVDVSYKYDKMYVVRPQFFIPIITILRNAAMNSIAYKKELILMKNQNLDITHFEENMNAFKEGFAKNYDLASKRFSEAIEEIDKTIDHLEKVKKALQSSENNLRLANDKAQDLTIKRLTKNAPSVKEKFEKLAK